MKTNAKNNLEVLNHIAEEMKQIQYKLELVFEKNAIEEANNQWGLAELVNLQAAANNALSAIKEVQTEAQKIFDHLRYRLVPNALEDAGMERASVKGVGTVYLADDLRTQIKDMEAVAEVLRKHGMGELVRETVHGQTLKALVKEFMQEGKEQELLDELQKVVNVQPFTVARIRKN